MMGIIHDRIGFLWPQVFSPSMPTLLLFHLLIQPVPERPLSVYPTNRPVPGENSQVRVLSSRSLLASEAEQGREEGCGTEIVYDTWT